MFNNSKLTVKFGNILETQAEVIVSSDNCYVTMGGGVSKAILYAGGSSIINDAKKRGPYLLAMQLPQPQDVWKNRNMSSTASQ